MALLLAVCGNKTDASVREVPLNASAQEAVAEAFQKQEAEFREGVEVPFDENWMIDAGEIATAAVPAGVGLFDEILTGSQVDLEPVSAEDFDDIHGLAMKPDTGHERVLVQVFGRGQSLTRPWLVSLLYEAGTYTRLESPGFRLDEKLVCIVENGVIRFRSLYNLGRVIDTSVIFGAATDGEIRQFVADYASMFDVADVNAFLDATSRNARKYITSVGRSGVLKNHTVQSLQDATEGTKLELEVHNGKIVMPSTGGGITELMRFLNDGRYVGPVSGEAYITNSRRRA
ncbi:MAG: hypothetical protein F4Y71_11270 [Acidobacteria bacterium]|nr:hypothetical protein [Acidobacteriota bacterium]MYG74986.1 hypothetical protein [Acidobacteriota bacterium]